MTEKKSSKKKEIEDYSEESSESTQEKASQNKDSSKNDSVKGQKTAKKRNFNLKIAAVCIIVLVVLVAIAAMFLLPTNMYKYNFTINGVNYKSNTYTPTEFGDEFKQNTTVYVSPKLIENGADQYVANAMNLWLVILNANNIDTIQLIRTTDAQGNMLGCYTNEGDVRTSKMISTQECNAILDDSSKAFIFIELASEDRVILSKNKLDIMSSKQANLGPTNFAVMEEMFPNAKEMLDKVNQIIYNVN